MSTILELLVALPIFVNLIKTPQPPEKFDRFVIPYTIICDDEVTKVHDSSKKLGEHIKRESVIFSGNEDDINEFDTLTKKTIYNMSESELNALSLKQKAKLLHMNKNTFKTFVKLVNREAGPKMQDKILVAAVVWNRKYCNQFPDTVKKVMFQPGQFTLKGDTKTTIHGNVNDKDAQLAILLAYKQVHTGAIPHNVQYFNCISYRTKNSKRFKKYKHYNNYFIKDTCCRCDWCKQTSS